MQYYAHRLKMYGSRLTCTTTNLTSMPLPTSSNSLSGKISGALARLPWQDFLDQTQEIRIPVLSS
jgi:hypothetical protein